MERCLRQRPILHVLYASFSSFSPKCPVLTKLDLVSPQLVEVVFENGQTFHLSAEFLRVQSPAADSKRRTISGEKVIAGRRNVGIMSMEPVGNYGIRICFDDLHSTGIYSWDYLYHLGANKFSLMREYLNMLKKHDLSPSLHEVSSKIYEEAGSAVHVVDYWSVLDGLGFCLQG
ncbi:hypothetical protein GOP47_0023497 [Adiantum capillus-veneris]|uniref:Gamma-butyrobetaine hydroxylase-like N-terminal domain-containing protein n=1 Tax=Adiantum capillus-veneris TaxID=13818 RepID=A0A9D4U407_ADICA|nr:hypothetical protein GOP47_0023497 [Adiantum capillus-veneris]